MGSWSRRRRVVAAIFGLAVSPWVPPAAAQLRLPPITLPSPGGLRDLTAPAVGTATSVAAAELADVRKLRILELLRTHRELIDVDRVGNPIVRGEIVAFAPTEAALNGAAAAGLAVLRREALAGLDAELVILSVPRSNSIHRALKRLRQADPAGTYDYNHVYLGVGDAIGQASAASPHSDPGAATRVLGSVGLIDTGVDVGHTAFKEVQVALWGCAGKAVPDGHGTAVGSLLAGHDDTFHGAAPGASLFAADVYCGRPDGGAVDLIAAAFAWLAAQRVPVISVSLVGPRDETLAAVVSRVIARGQIIVAAVGNDGPSAPPLYPAAYPGVIAVTGVDAHRHVLLEANRGPHVAFAAPGADMVAATVGGGYREVRGTSFAAPIVAGLLAQWCSLPGPSCAGDATRALAQEAIDLGRKGRDPVYGFGLVGESVRTAPNK